MIHPVGDVDIEQLPERRIAILQGEGYSFSGRYDQEVQRFSKMVPAERDERMAEIRANWKQDGAPVGPGPDHEEFEIGIEERRFTILDDSTSIPFDPPSNWTLINEPPSTAFP